MPEVLAAGATFTPAGCLPLSHQTPKPMSMVGKCLRRSSSRASRLPRQPANPAGFSPAPAPSSNRRWKQQSWPQTRAHSIPGELRAAQEGRNQRFGSRAGFFLSPLLHFTPNHPQRGCQAPKHTAAGPAQLGNPLKAPKSSGKSPRGGAGGGLGAQRRGRSPRPLNKPGRPAHLPAVLGCVVLCCVASFLPSLPPSSAVSPAGLPTPRGGAGGCARPAPGRAPPHPPPPQLLHVPSKGPRPFPRWQGTPRPAKYPAFCCLVNFKPSSSRL